MGMKGVLVAAAAMAAMAAVGAQAQTQAQGGGQERHRGPGLFRGALAADGGSVTQAQLDAALQARMQARGRTMRPRAEARVNQLFQMADANHDGTVTAAEFRAAQPRIRAERMQWREQRMQRRQAMGATTAR